MANEYSGGRAHVETQVLGIMEVVMDQVFRKGHVSWDYVQVSISFLKV